MATANGTYKEYRKKGGTLGFKDWIQREKTKGFLNADGTATVPSNAPLTDSVASAIAELHIAGGEQTGLDNKYIFGINRNVLIVAGLVAVGTAAYFIIKHKMQKK